VILGRGRYAAIVDSQLELFTREHRDLIEAVRERLAAYNRAERDEAEEAYGDYLDAVEAGTEILAEMRDSYAATLERPGAYLRAFNRGVAKRLPPFDLELENR
jgi:hypothetical protein